MFVKLAALAGLALVGLWSLRHWKRAIRLALWLLVFEGALRKWVLPGAQELLYFAKDGVLLAAYVGFLRTASAEERQRVHAPALSVLLVVGALFGAAQMWNPGVPNVKVGLLGFKAYFLYIPLVWLVPATFSSRAQLWRFLRIYVLAAIPMAALGALQFASGTESSLNAYARSGGGAIDTFGSSSHVRVTGTFSYISGFSEYLIALALLALGLLTATRWRVRSHPGLFAALGATLAAMLMTGSRGPILMVAVSLVPFLVLVSLRDRDGAALGAKVLGLLAIVLIGVNLVASEAVGAFAARAAGSGDVPGRVFSPFIQPFRVLPQAGLLGYGIGVTHQAAANLADAPGLFEAIFKVLVEDETGRIMLELGPIGFLLVYASRLAVIGVALRGALTAKDGFCRVLSITCAIFLALHIPGGVVFNPTGGVYFWFFAGLAFTVRALDARVGVPAVAERRSGAPSLAIGTAVGS